MAEKSSDFNERPPTNALRVNRWADLPGDPVTKTFEHWDGAEWVPFSAAGHDAQVLAGLMERPVYAASFARVSDCVFRLRGHGLDIETIMYRNDPETRRKRYGVFFLRSPVRQTQQAVAA